MVHPTPGVRQEQESSFAASLLARLELRDSPSSRRTQRLLVRLAEWGFGEGLPLDAEVLLDPDTVERFVQFGLDGERSAATYRSVLRRIGPLLTDHAPWEPRPHTLARRQVAPPYAPQEVEMLRSDGHDQPTAARRRGAHALLALGLGAGLDGRWAAKVRSADVRRRSGVVTVSVGAPSPRSVAVLAQWEDEVVHLATMAGDEFLVGGRSISRNRAGAIAASLVVPPGHPRLSAPRLRSTWLVWHLRAGTRLAELAAAAGLQGITVLSDLLAYVSPGDEVTAARMLREAQG